MSKRLTKADLRKVLGTTDAGVADFFEITRAAVAQWGEDDPIPELRQLQAERKRPDLFADGDVGLEAHRTGAADEGDAAQAAPAAAPVSEAA